MPHPSLRRPHHRHRPAGPHHHHAIARGTAKLVNDVAVFINNAFVLLINAFVLSNIGVVLALPRTSQPLSPALSTF